MASSYAGNGTAVSLPPGATLNHAILAAGGLKVLHGPIEFVRFKHDGTVDRRKFAYDPNSQIESFKNPVLISKDAIRVRNSLLSSATEVITEFTTPAIGVY